MRDMRGSGVRGEARDGRAVSARTTTRAEASTRACTTRCAAARAAAAGVTAAVLAVTLAACGGSAATGKDAGKARGDSPARKLDPTRVPGVGDPLQQKIPRDARQVVAVYGQGENSAEATVRLYTKRGPNWHEDRSWPAHNGRKGWTPDHKEGDKRSPVGVFTLSDAGGVLPAPDAKLPYTNSADFTPPSYWPKKTRHDFDHVIAVNYNRVKGTSPLDPTRPQGQSKGGSIWLHMDHGSGTSGCVSLPKSGMEYLLRTLDPDKQPAVVMGDKAALAAR